MSVREIRPGVIAVGVQDWNRQLFDELIPLPHGTSYNAYLVKGSEKTALIDTVDPPKGDELLENLKKAGVEKLDYIISNHAEQDHSGSIPIVLEAYPEAQPVTNAKCSQFLMDLLHIDEGRIMAVADGDALSLGDKTLEFILAPWVHWPETMFTYLKEEKILFSGDFLGSHLATSDLFVKDEKGVYLEAKRYYAEIMMPFRTSIVKHLEKIDAMDIEAIAPTHGQIYDRPAFILDAYRDWTSDEPRKGVMIVYASMHGSTRKMTDHLVSRLMEAGMPVKVFDLPRSDIGEVAMALMDSSTLVIGAPTVLAGPHPAVIYAAALVNALRPRLSHVGIYGSYNWGGRTVDVIKATIPNVKAELFDPVMIKGLPRNEDLAEIDRLAENIINANR